MYACLMIRRIAEWLLAMPVPDPDLQCELAGWALGLQWVAQGIERWWVSRWAGSEGPAAE